MGGYGTILIFDAKTGKSRLPLHSSAASPPGPPGRLPRPDPNYLENRRGAKAISTRGDLHAWEALHGYGTRPWKESLGARHPHRRGGLPHRPTDGGGARGRLPRVPAEAQAVFGRAGKPLAAARRWCRRISPFPAGWGRARGGRLYKGGRSAGHRRRDEVPRRLPGPRGPRPPIARVVDLIHIDYRGHEVDGRRTPRRRRTPSRP